MSLFFINIIEHYLFNYTLTWLVFIKCICFGWFYGWDNVKENFNKKSIAIFYIGYWLSSLFWPIIGVFVLGIYAWTVFLAWVGVMAGVIILSYAVSGHTFKDWVRLMWFAGVWKMAEYIAAVSDPNKTNSKRKNCCLTFIKIWFSLCVKFIVPSATFWLLFFNIYQDDQSNFMGYPQGALFVGGVLVIISFLLFSIPGIICRYPNKLSHDPDDPFEDIPAVLNNKVNDQIEVGSPDRQPNKRANQASSDGVSEVNVSEVRDASRVDSIGSNVHGEKPPTLPVVASQPSKKSNKFVHEPEI